MNTSFAKFSASLVLTALLPNSVLAEPVVIAGNSGDDWEKAPLKYLAEVEQLRISCRPLAEHQVALLAGEDVVAQLKETSVALVDETLVRRLGPRALPDGYRPYLVRAFRWQDRITNLHIDDCGGYIRTMIFTNDAGPNPKPERAAAVVFLPSAPQGSFGQWIQGAPGPLESTGERSFAPQP